MSHMGAELDKQRAALEYINAELERSKTGRYASLANAERVGARIQSSLIARKMLLESRKSLRKAAEALKGYNLWDKALGLLEANVRLIEGNLNSINKAEEELPAEPMAPVKGLLAAKVGLIALQSYDNLNSIRISVAQSAAEGTIISIINEFGDALAFAIRTTVDNVVVPVISQAPKIAWSLTPLIVPAALTVGGFFLLKTLMLSRSA